jgi:hypothetical protein
MNSVLQSNWFADGDTMSPTRILKKYFPDSPEWFHAGLLLVCLVWLIVLSVEISSLLAGHDFENPTWAWFVRPLYAPGRVFIITIYQAVGGGFPPMRSSIGENIIVLLLCLVISSPVYFIIGTSFAARNISLGVLLLVAKFLFGCLCIFYLAVLLDH